MRREHQIDQHRVNQPLHSRGIHPAFFEFQHRGLDGLANRTGFGGFGLRAETRRPAAAKQQDAEIFLGQIHQLEIKREGHRLIERLLRSKRCHRLPKCGGCGVITGATGLGERAQLLDRRQGGRTFQPGDHPAQRRSQSADFSPELGKFFERGGRAGS